MGTSVTENKTTPSTDPSSSTALTGKALVEEIAAAAWEKKAIHLVAMDVGELVGYTDHVLICSGNSDRQVNAIAEHIESTLKANHKMRPNGVEGRSSGRWVLLDYVDVVIHILYQPVRDYYELEKLWSDATEIPLEEPDWLQADPTSPWDLR